MPYRKSYGKKKVYKKKSNTTCQLALKALNKVNKISKGIELKYFDTAISDTTLASAGTILPFSNASNGTTDSTVIGDKFSITSYTIRLSTTAKTAVTTQQGYVRYIIVALTSPHSSYAITDVLETATVTSQWKRDASVNWKVLYDKTMYIEQPGTGAKSIYNQVIRKRFKPAFIRRNDGTSVEGGLYLIVLHNYEDEDINIQGTARINFTDL